MGGEAEVGREEERKKKSEKGRVRTLWYVFYEDASHIIPAPPRESLLVLAVFQRLSLPNKTPMVGSFNF